MNFDALINASSPSLSGDSVGFIINNIVRDYIFPGAGIVLFLYFLMGAYELLLSGGNPKSVASGKAKITNAIVGFIIMFVSYWIVQGLAIALGLGSIETIF